MKSKVIILFSFLLAMASWQAACHNRYNPSSPEHPAPTITPTFTVTITPTGTISPTATPLCTNAIDVTSYIDNGDYLGDDNPHALPAGLNLDHGGLSVGDILTFTLAASTELNFSLCATEDPDRKLVLYIRPVCVSSSGETFNAGYCEGLPEITGLTLAAGTYYMIIAENTGTDAPAGGNYDLRIKSGNVSSVICNPFPGVVPEAISPTMYGSCSAIYQLNGDPPDGQFGAPFSGIRQATGSLDESDTIANSDDFVSFTPLYSGGVTVTLDCFDNGLNVQDFDIFVASSCPTAVGSSPSIITQSDSMNPTELCTFAGTGGTTYYVDVDAYQGTGPYRLTIQTP